jgi:hypothetical protein
MAEKIYGCKIHCEHITKPPNANHGTHLAKGCSSYKPLGKTTEIIGMMIPAQCNMCINFGILKNEQQMKISHELFKDKTFNIHFINLTFKEVKELQAKLLNKDLQKIIDKFQKYYGEGKEK